MFYSSMPFDHSHTHVGTYRAASHDHSLLRVVVVARLVGVSHVPLLDLDLVSSDLASFDLASSDLASWSA